MFIQVLRGRIEDAAAMREASDRWQAELKPGANGYLGLTSGVADDGRFIAVTRFESEDAARANSERPEQDSWWQKTSKLFLDAPRFYDCSIVDTHLGGVRNDAGFVQIEVFTGIKDLDAFRAVAVGFEKLAHLRPDLLGVTASYTNNGTGFGTNYFTSETQAREVESQEPPAEVMALAERWSELTDGVEYIDLRDPWHTDSRQEKP